MSDIVLTLDTASEERLPQDPDFEPDEVLHGCAAWSPDGLTLACEVFFHNEPERNGLFLEAVSTGELTQVTNSPGGEDNPGDFSPDGTRICFVRVDADRSEAANRAVHVVDVDGSHLQRISPWTGGGDLTSSWSPDGAWILYTANERIHAVHPDGSGDHLIDIDLGTNVYSALFPRWSEDGTWIVFSLARPDVYGLNVYVARADGSDAFQVTTALPGSQEVDEGDEFPDW